MLMYVFHILICCMTELGKTNEYWQACVYDIQWMDYDLGVIGRVLGLSLFWGQHLFDQGECLPLSQGNVSRFGYCRRMQIDVRSFLGVDTKHECTSEGSQLSFSHSPLHASHCM